MASEDFVYESDIRW